jgi:hypothetical protein
VLLDVAHAGTQLDNQAKALTNNPLSDFSIELRVYLAEERLSEPMRPVFVDFEFVLLQIGSHGIRSESYHIALQQPPIPWYPGGQQFDEDAERSLDRDEVRLAILRIGFVATRAGLRFTGGPILRDPKPFP